MADCAQELEYGTLAVCRYGIVVGEAEIGLHEGAGHPPGLLVMGCAGHIYRSSAIGIFFAAAPGVIDLYVKDTVVGNAHLARQPGIYSIKSHRPGAGRQILVRS